MVYIDADGNVRPGNRPPTPMQSFQSRLQAPAVGGLRRWQIVVASALLLLAAVWQLWPAPDVESIREQLSVPKVAWSTAPDQHDENLMKPSFSATYGEVRARPSLGMIVILKMCFPA